MSVVAVTSTIAPTIIALWWGYINIRFAEAIKVIVSMHKRISYMQQLIFFPRVLSAARQQMKEEFSSSSILS